jgi:hypothetical protein
MLISFFHYRHKNKSVLQKGTWQIGEKFYIYWGSYKPRFTVWVLSPFKNNLTRFNALGCNHDPQRKLLYSDLNGYSVYMRNKSSTYPRWDCERLFLISWIFFCDVTRLIRGLKPHLSSPSLLPSVLSLVCLGMTDMLKSFQTRIPRPMYLEISLANVCNPNKTQETWFM